MPDGIARLLALRSLFSLWWMLLLGFEPPLLPPPPPLLGLDRTTVSWREDPLDAQLLLEPGPLPPLTGWWASRIGACCGLGGVRLRARSRRRGAGGDCRASSPLGCKPEGGSRSPLPGELSTFELCVPSLKAAGADALRSDAAECVSFGLQTLAAESPVISKGLEAIGHRTSLAIPSG